MRQEAFSQIASRSVEEKGSERPDFSHWHVIQRAFLRFRLISQNAKAKIRVAEAKNSASFWKEKYHELKKAADEMLEQFHIEKEVQNEMIAKLNEKVNERINITKSVTETPSQQGKKLSDFVLRFLFTFLFTFFAFKIGWNRIDPCAARKLTKSGRRRSKTQKNWHNRRTMK